MHELENEMPDWAVIRERALAGLGSSSMPPEIHLPAFPYAVTLFAQRSRDETVPLSDLAKILETDSGLTTPLLKYVNSTFLGVQKKVVGVTQALLLLGSRHSRHFVIATGMEASIRAHNSKLINQNAFWGNNLRRAIFSREIAALLQTDAEIAFLGALLQDYLLPVLTNDLADTYREFLQAEDANAESLSDFEQSRFGWDHALVGARLAHDWNLPDELVCCIRYHHSGPTILNDARLGQTPVAATALSALLPDCFRPNYWGIEQLLTLQDGWPEFCLEKLAESVDQQYLQQGLGVRNAMPLLPICRRIALKRALKRTAR